MQSVVVQSAFSLSRPKVGPTHRDIVLDSQRRFRRARLDAALVDKIGDQDVVGVD